MGAPTADQHPLRSECADRTGLLVEITGGVLRKDGGRPSGEVVVRRPGHAPALVLEFTGEQCGDASDVFRALAAAIERASRS